MRDKLRVWFVIPALLLAGCGAGRGGVASTPVGDATQAGRDASSAHASPTLAPSQTPPATLPPASPVETPSARRPTAAPQASICSPLEGVSLANLEGSIVNPYSPPPPGSDDPHQGVDFAYTLLETGIALAGEPVYAILGGKVAGAVRGRFPYGNAVMIETRVEDLPPGLVDLPEGSETPQASTALTCPDVEVAMPAGEGKSLYTLYAHLESAPEDGLDQAVACGEPLGSTGDSGNALNPHLHVEMRLGPSGMRFESMAHYDPAASDLEMALYCLWRVSGVFMLVDPMAVLSGR